MEASKSMNCIKLKTKLDPKNLSGVSIGVPKEDIFTQAMCRQAGSRETRALSLSDAFTRLSRLRARGSRTKSVPKTRAFFEERGSK